MHPCAIARAVLAAVLVTGAAPAAAYNRQINCGSDQAVVGPGELTYGADLAYDGTTVHAGYVGGATNAVSRPLSRWRGHADPYDSTRDGAFDYRFDVPPGDYLVTLGFVDYCTYWAADPCANTFDVLVEGVRAASGLRVERAAQGGWKVLELRVPANVLDGTLDVAIVPLEGTPHLGAIDVVDRPVVPGPPAPPQGLRAQDGYGRVDLLWSGNAEPDLAGYRVYRALAADGPWGEVDARPLNLQTIHNDLSVPEGSAWFYRVTAVDIDGEESAPSAVVTGAAHGPWESLLPVVEVRMSEADVDALNRSYWTDVYFPADVAYPGLAPQAGRARYRGNIARWFTKRCWKLKLDGAASPDFGDTLNLNSDMWDAFMVRKCLSFDQYRARGVLALNCRPVHLLVNGEFYGVAQQFENSDKYLLSRLGLDLRSELFKSDGGGLTVAANPADYRTQYEQENGTSEGYALLQRSIEAINAPGSDEMNAIAENFDLPDFVQYYATMNFLSEWDSCVHNFDLLLDPGTRLWRFIPLDHDGSWGNGPWDPYSINSGSNVGICTEAQQGVGWNKLYDLYMNNLQGRKRHSVLLRQLMGTGGPWSVDALAPAIDAAVVRVLVDAQRDVNKFPWEDNGPIEAATARLQQYVTERWASVQSNLTSSYSTWREPDDDFNVYINEYMAKNTKTIRDEAGQFDPWIELHNAAPYPVNAGGMYLSDDVNTPKKWVLPAGTVIPAGGFLLVWADNEPAQGPLHASFKLLAAGGKILLTSHTGTAVQRTGFNQQRPDIAQGMLRDGYFRWRRFLTASPGRSNAEGVANAPAAVSLVHHVPAYPGAQDAATVTAKIVDDGTPISVTAWFKQYVGAGAVWNSTPMIDDGAHGDGSAGDGVYGASLPAQAAGRKVDYYIVVSDNVAVETRAPDRAPDRTYSYVIGAPPPALQVNEFMADNAGFLADEKGEFEDWVEIRSNATSDVDLTGMYLSDDPAVPDTWRFPDGTILRPGERLLVWCDNDPVQGPLHATFKLSKSGESLVVFDRDETGRAVVDRHDFGPQVTDWSEGRWPEGSGSWVRFFNATPNAPNEEPDAPPTIGPLQRDPAAPTQADEVAVTAALADDHGLTRTQLFVDTGAGFAAQPLLDDGQHRDGAAGDGVYGALIPAQPLGVTVRYYVEAEDTRGRVTRNPPRAPLDFASYVIGYRRPLLAINEFLADNGGSARDEAGDAEDWVEIYNADAAAADLSGLYLTDDFARPDKWRIPDGTVLGAGQFLLVFCDEEPSEGRFHAAFKLSKGGEQIGLYDTDANGRTLVDSVVFGAQTKDRSEGRSADGGAEWTFFAAPTPGDPNGGFAAVTGVTAHGYNTVVDVAWTAHADPLVSGYEVLAASAQGGPYARLNPQPAIGPMLLWRDLGLVNGAVRWYRVRALKPDGSRSRGSAPLFAVPAAGETTPVTDLLVRREGTDVVLIWSVPTSAPPVGSVEVFRDETPLLDADVDAGSHLYAVATEPGRFVDATAAGAPATHFYVVRSVDTEGRRATE